MEIFREIALKLNTEQIGQIQLILVQGVSEILIKILKVALQVILVVRTMN